MTTILTLLALAAIAWLVFRWLTAGTRKRVLHDVEVEAVDGDTIRLEGLEKTIRLARVDAPEVGQPGAEAATQAVRRALEEGEEARVVSMERGKWGRHVAEVEVDGRNLSDMLLERGLAERY